MTDLSTRGGPGTVATRLSRDTVPSRRPEGRSRRPASGEAGRRRCVGAVGYSYSTTSCGVLANRFQPKLSVSLYARSPSVTSVAPAATWSATAAVTSNSTSPAGQAAEYPLAVVTALASVTNAGWLDHVVTGEIGPVSHRSTRRGVQEYDHVSGSRRVARRTCRPATPLVSIRKNDRCTVPPPSYVPAGASRPVWFQKLAAGNALFT